MDFQTKGKPVREFFDIEAQALFNNFKSIEAILPHKKNKGATHPAEEGRFVESLLRNFLNKHLPQDLIALSGFIIKPATKTGDADYQRVESEFDKHSGQIDIIVYDRAHFPIYERFEEFAIVPPEGVIGIISVKKTLRLNQVEKEFNGLKHSASICYPKNGRSPYLGIFAFNSDFKPDDKKIDVLKDIYKQAFDYQPFHHMVNELTVLNNFIIFKFQENATADGEITFVKIDCCSEMHIALQRLIQSLLGVYYHKSLNKSIERPGFVSFEKGVFNNAERFVYVKKEKAQ